MGPSDRNPQAIHFADYSLDLRTAELCRNGDKVTLQDQPFQILTALLETPGQLVTREELIKRLWPSGTFVDFDQSLNKAVARLREALYDSADNPRFVETLPRRGYRWIGTVVDHESVPDKTAASTLPPLTSSSEILAPTGSGGSGSSVKRSWRWYALTAFLGLVGVGVWIGVRSQPPRSLDAAPIRSLAVLPMESLSTDPAQKYFAEGITEELISRLTRMSSVRVISRSSAMNYADSHKAIPEIARELRVDGIIEGSVMRLGDRVRIRVQLTDAPHDRQLWSATYERSLQDVLELQADAARDIAGEIKLELTRQDLAWLSEARKVHPEAYDLYLKGRYFWNKRDRPGIYKAIDYFQQAIAKDPNYAEAYAGLADAYLMVPGTATGPPRAILPQAKAAAQKALQLDDRIAEAHDSLALISSHLEWKWDEAKKHYERAIELNPNYATAHHWYGDAYLAPVGRFDEAIAEMRKAQALDPLSPIIGADIGKNLVFARRNEEAISELKKTLELDPNFDQAHHWLWYAYLENRNYEQAKVELESSRRYRGERLYLADWALLEAQCGDKKTARELLGQLVKNSRQAYTNPATVAVVFIALGDNDNAFLWLDKASDLMVIDLISLKVDPLWDGIRGDPRFPALLRRVGVP